MKDEETVLVTKRGLEKLKKELVEVETELFTIRQQKGIAADTAGNAWHDNAEFERLQQKEDMALSRIRRLKSTIGKARIIEETSSSEEVGIGTSVTLEIESGTQLKVRLVGVSEADVSRHEISYQSPLGAALMGKKAGDVVEYKAPSGLKRGIIQKIE